MPENILNIIAAIAALDQRDRDLVNGLFSVQRSQGALEIPAPLAPKIARWYGRPDDSGPEAALDRARSQALVRTLNRWTLEGAVFNPLRA
ncbi:MAG TPA: hypothetical protein VGM03_22565, partial [Phycisphaerae bacterium]